MMIAAAINKQHYYNNSYAINTLTYNMMDSTSHNLLYAATFFLTSNFSEQDFVSAIKLHCVTHLYVQNFANQVLNQLLCG
jgi:hypothetical protein